MIGAYSEPIPGWVDNVYGLTGVLAAGGAGLLRTMVCDTSLKTDLVPVDMTVNAGMAVAWEAARLNR